MYITPPEILRQPAEQQLIGPWSGFAQQEASTPCTCGFRLIFQISIFHSLQMLQCGSASLSVSVLWPLSGGCSRSDGTWFSCALPCALHSARLYRARSYHQHFLVQFFLLAYFKKYKHYFAGSIPKTTFTWILSTRSEFSRKRITGERPFIIWAALQSKWARLWRWFIRKKTLDIFKFDHF